jgi:hypothetical protein
MYHEVPAWTRRREEEELAGEALAKREEGSL